ncbi:MAG: hypothetical protein RLZZ182_359, partial [Pseudomonadota bacterium]
VSPITDSDAQPDEVAENAANGSVVGLTASAFDADGSLNAISYRLSDDAGGRFTIDASTGQVTVADGSRLDQEAQSSHSITIEAQSADGSVQSRTFVIQLTDVNDNAVVMVGDMDAGDNVVMPDATDGSAVGVTARAVDADSTGNVVTYTLISNPSGAFAIDSQSGMITLQQAALLDRQTTSMQRVTVMAQSADGSSTTLSFDIRVMGTPAPVAPPTQPIMLMSEPIVVPPPTPEAGPPEPVNNEPEPAPTTSRATAPASRTAATAAPMAATPEAAPLTVVMPTLGGTFVPQPVSLSFTVALVNTVVTTDLATVTVAPLNILTLPDLNPAVSLNGLLSTDLRRLSLPAAPVTMAQTADLPMSLETLAPTLMQMGGLTLSLGSVFWLSRASTLLTSLLVATPIWRTMDPLPVLASGGLGGGPDGPDDKDAAADEGDRTAEGMFADVPAQHESIQIIG